MQEYRKDTERYTILWFAGIMILAVLCLIGSVLFPVTVQVELVLLSVGIILASIGVSIFLVAILYPAIMDALRKPKKYDDEL